MENKVCHYTNWDGLKGIIGHDLCLWATRYDHLNDPHEQIWAQDVVLDYIRHEPSSIGVPKDFYATYAYIISFCEIPDYRNMWRLYCNDGVGFCLVFDADTLSAESEKNTMTDFKNKHDIFESVLYSSQKNIKKTVDYLKDGELFKCTPNEPAYDWMSLCAFIKDEDFSIENEMRYARIRENDIISITYNPLEKDNVELFFKENKNDLKIRKRGDNELIPYIEIHFPPNALKQIIIGYQYKFDEAKIMVNNILKEYGNTYHHVEIKESLLY